LYIVHNNNIHIAFYFTPRVAYTNANPSNVLDVILIGTVNNVKNVMEQTTIIGQTPMMCLYILDIIDKKKIKNFYEKKKLKYHRDM